MSTVLLFLFCALSCGSSGSSSAAGIEIPATPDQAYEYLKKIESDYPSIAKVETFGSSKKGNVLSSLILTKNPGVIEKEPAVRLTGTIHGDEEITMYVLLKFARYLTENYGKRDEVTSIIDGVNLVIIPLLNPDGFAMGTRYNASGVDLNRNFSTYWQSAPGHGDGPFSEAETSAFRDYGLEKVFSSSITYHSGAVVVNMPFDYAREADGVYPDEYEMVKFLAYTYSRSGSFLSTPGLLSLPEVNDGVVNGGNWYIVYGSLQDWSYLETGCPDLTIEIYEGSPRDEETVEKIFQFNLESMLAFCLASKQGVSGKITDDTGGPLEGVWITVNEGDCIGQSNSEGFYHRVLPEGEYLVEFRKDGFGTVTKSISLTGTSLSYEMDIVLSR